MSKVAYSPTLADATTTAVIDAIPSDLFYEMSKADQESLTDAVKAIIVGALANFAALSRGAQNSDPDLMEHALDCITALATGGEDPGYPDVSDEHVTELSEAGFSIEMNEGRFITYDGGQEFGPNDGHATLDDAWRACAVESGLYTCYGEAAD